MNIKLKYIPIIEIIADIITKLLAKLAFELLCLKLSIISLTNVELRM
jgi:hypothetical protein